MAIDKTSQETINKIKANSVIVLPDKPKIPPEQLKKAFVKPIIDTNNSLINELDRIIDKINADFEQVTTDTTNAIGNHNTSNEAHTDIREDIQTLEEDLQGQINEIDGTLESQDTRIGVLEDFASNLETDITEEIENAVADKADLVDGKVPLEQLPDMEITKEEIEDVLTGDITSHNHATEINNHNTSETAHTGIRNAVAEAKAIAEGKSRARVFATESALDTWLLDSENVALLQIGDNFYIEEIDKPDYWWNGTTIKELETQKVDLTEYAKKTELLTLGTTSNDAYRGDLGQIAYNHSQSAHAPSNAQKNVQSDWNQTDNTKDDYIKNKPTIPTIPDLALNDNTETSGKYISKIEVDSANKHKLNITKKDLPQGFSGDYNDLTNKPTIPTKTSDLTNDSGFLTALPTHNHDDRYYTESEIDTKLGGKADSSHTHTKSEITDFPTTMPPTAHNHDTLYYQKSETYSKAQTDALVGNLQGQTQELKSITTQPSGTFTYGDQYYNSTTKGLYYWNGTSWELTGAGAPLAGVIYSFNGVLYFWDESTENLIQIGGGVDLSNYYTKTEVDNAINFAILGLLGGES